MKIDLYAMLKTLLFTLENGKNLSSAMQLLANNTKTKKERKVYLKVNEQIKDGLSFSESLEKNKLGSRDVLNFIHMAEKGVSFKEALKKIIAYMEVKNEFERESNEKTSIPFIYFFLSVLIVVGVKFLAVPYQMNEAKQYSDEIIALIGSHLATAQLMTDILFISLIVVGSYFLLLMMALFSQSYSVQGITKQIALFLPVASGIILKFEKFILFSMLGEMLQSGISFQKAMHSAISTTRVYKFRTALEDTLKSIKYDGKFTFHSALYDDVEQALLVGIGSSYQVGSVMVEISKRAKVEALALSAKFFRIITFMSIFLMTFAVFIEFYTVVLTQVLIQKGLIDLTRSAGTIGGVQ